MNEIEIYREISDLFKKQKKKVNRAWLLFALYVIYALVMVFLPLLQWATILTVFVPLVAVLTLIFLAIRGEYILAKKYPLVFNKWLWKDNFVNRIESYSRERLQPDPNHVKIQNSGLEYIDDVINTYYGDKFKLSNGFYNAIINTSLFEEITFYEKYKTFIKDMNVYRDLL